MKNTSKKMISFLLAVIMAFTSCSVGLTAFASDSRSLAYSDKAEKDYENASEVFDYCVRIILNSSVSTGQPLYKELGVSPYATAQEVIGAASPMILKVLNGGSKSSTDLKTFITSHSSVTAIDESNWKDGYAKYFDYLTDPNPQADDLTFIELYTFCEENANNSNETVKRYAANTINDLNIMLQVACRAITDQSTAPNKAASETFRTILNAGVTKNETETVIEKISEGISVEEINNLPLWTGRVNSLELNGRDYRTIAETADDYDVRKGIEEANRALKASGSTVTVSTPAEALAYYYLYYIDGFSLYDIFNPTDSISRTKLTYQQAIEYVRLAEKGGKPIKVGGVALTTANCEATVKAYLEEQQAAGNPLYENYVDGLEYLYLPKVIFLSMNDLYCQDAQDALWDGTHDFSDASNVPWANTNSTNTLDAFASSSYEAINKALLMENGLTETDAVKKIEDAKFTDEIIEKLWNDAKRYEANAVDSPKFREYLTSDKCTYLNVYQKAFFNATASLNDNDFLIIHQALKAAKTAEDAKNIKYLSAADKDFILQNGAFYECVAYRHAPATFTLDDDGNFSGEYKEVNFFDFYNEICSGIVTNVEIASGTQNIFAAASCPIYDSLENAVAKRVLDATSGINYTYSKFTMPPAVKEYYESSQTASSVEDLNATLNGLLDTYFSGKGSVDIGKVVNDLLETNITLFASDGSGALNDLWKRLYENPVETVFNLLPVLMILLDEVALPIALNSDNAYLGDDVSRDSYYNDDNGLISNILEGLKISLLAPVDANDSSKGKFIVRDENGKINVGTIFNSLDLNKILPSLLAFFSGDAEKARSISGTYGDYLKKYNVTDNATESEEKVQQDVIAFTGIYVADKVIFGINLDDTAQQYPQDAERINFIKDLIGYAYDAVEEYLAECKADAEHKDYRYVKVENANTECATLQTGLNNLAISLPKVFHKICQKCIEANHIDYDMDEYLDGKFVVEEKQFSNCSVQETHNYILENFKAKYNYENRNGAIEIYNTILDFATEKSDILFDIASLYDKYFSYKDGVLYNKGMDCLIRVRANKAMKEYVVPDSVKTVAPFAFFACNELTSVTFPREIGLLYKFIFFGCDKIADVVYLGPEKQWTKNTSNELNEWLSKHNVTLHFNADTDVLDYLKTMISEYARNDYSDDTYTALLNKFESVPDDLSNLTQQEVDSLTTSLLESMYDLKPYLNLSITAPNGTFTVEYDNNSNVQSKTSVLSGTTVTLTAVPNDGYKFVGWYDTVNNLYFSKDSKYTFKIVANTNLKAVFVKNNSATLTFTTYTNWVKSTVTKTVDEWQSVTSIAGFVPEVPYRYGYINGRWAFDEAEVLAKLQAGEDVSVVAEYDKGGTELPTPPVAENGVPALELHYNYDDVNQTASFLMGVGIPENCNVESLGILYYYKEAESFDPTNFTLLINNKMTAGKYNAGKSSGLCIANIRNFTSEYNWAVRGYISYYDAENNLVTVYSNQINVVDRRQVIQ